MIERPPLVGRALAVAERLGFDRSCSDETGRLLHALAAQQGRARVAEIGTGSGAGAAWIVAGLPPEAVFVSAEREERLAVAAAELFASDPNASILRGDWRDILPAKAPFDLLFVDARDAKEDLSALGLLAPGATLLIDDLAPGRSAADPVRDLWLGTSEVAAVELAVSPREAVILAVRVL